MGKTPYELRYELLMMAQSIVTENIMSERIRLENDWNASREISMRVNDHTLPSFPMMPEIKVSDIVALAEQLNKFVSKDS